MFKKLSRVIFWPFRFVAKLRLSQYITKPLLAILRLVKKILSKIWLPKPLRRLVNYISQSFTELGKVTWPKRKEATRLTLAVIVFTGLFTLVTVIADFVFSEILDKVFLS